MFTKLGSCPLGVYIVNTCMISLFVTLWTIPSWNIGKTIKKRKTAKLSWFWTIPISRKFTDLGIVWVFNLCAGPSSPHHLRLVGWAGIHTNYQITQGPLRRPPSSNQSNSIRFRLWFPNWCWHSHCLTLHCILNGWIHSLLHVSVVLMIERCWPRFEETKTWPQFYWIFRYVWIRTGF